MAASQGLPLRRHGKKKAQRSKALWAEGDLTLGSHITCFASCPCALEGDPQSPDQRGARLLSRGNCSDWRS